MANIVVFLSLFTIYIVFISFYIKRQVDKLIESNVKFEKEELEAEFLYIVRNVLYLTGIVFIVNSYVLLGRDFDVKVSESQIGLILAVGTVVFYIAFTVWDIIKHRINKFFISKYGIEIDKKVLFGGIHIISIVLFSILLLEFVLSIITIIAL